MANFDGTPGNDVFNGDGADDIANGMDGNDTLNGNGGNDFLFGANGDDVLDGGAGNDTLYGGADNDTLQGGADNDYLVGGAGRDSVSGGTGDDTIAFTDIHEIVAGETYDGGDGFDTLSYDWSHGFNEVVDLTSVTLTGIEFINGRGFQNTFAADTYLTAAQLDALTGTVGTFYITTAGTVTWTGGKLGSTNFYLSAAGNTFDMSGATSNDANPLQGAVIGNAGNDVITGTAFEDHLEGNGGNDVINGGAGSDWIYGGLGVDEMHGGDGDDRFIIHNAGEIVAGETYDGGAGTDVLEYDVNEQLDLTTVSLAGIEGLVQAGYQEARVTLAQLGAMTRLQGHFYLSGAGTLSLSGVDFIGGLILAEGNNVIDLTGTIGDFQQVIGKGGTDTVTGSNQGNDLHGGDGNDTLSGLAGNDTLFGEAGNDVLNGGADNDELHGGAGIDTLNAGAGDDSLFTDSGDAVSGETYDGGDGNDTLTASGDLSGSTIANIERIWATGLTLTVAQINGFAWYNGSFTLANGGTVSFAGKEVTTVSITTSAAGNTVDFSSTSNAAMNFGFDIIGLGGSDLLTGAGGTDQFRGGGGDDVIHTAGGGDYLEGGAGKDALYGGVGDDRFYIGNSTDQVAGETIDGGDGIDQLFCDFGTNVDISQSTVTGVEVLIAGLVGKLTLTAAQLDYATSISGDFQLAGGGSVTLDGMTLEGISNAANITLSSVGNTIDLHGAAPGINVIAAGGDDTIIGTAADETLLGQGGNDVLIGNEGNDTLNGGTGADQLFGGTGNDTYMVDRQDDVVYETLGEGTDTVIASGNYYLYANTEILRLAAGAGDIFGVGNEQANSIYGNEGANLLLAGAGDDTVQGGAGGDQIYGQDGVDRLSGEAGVDYLIGGAGNDFLYGGDDEDGLYGEDGEDALYGGDDFKTDIMVGGAGDDFLHADSGKGDYDLLDGGAGNDSFYVDTYADVTYEAADGGTDTVYASTIASSGYYLYANVENLVLTGNTFYGVGNELANVMTGSAQANWLLGGAGNDTLNGKAGDDVLFGQDGTDIFVFEHGTGGDTIADFTAGTDRIDLSAIGFASYQDIVNSMHEVNGTTAIDLGGGDFIVLQGVAAASLHEGDFVLSGGSSGNIQVEQPAARQAADPLSGHDWRAGLIHQFDNPHMMVSGF